MAIQATIENLARTKRVNRNPVHTFHTKTPPFCIQPFMIAPVLAGETMKNLMLQARIVTDPIKNRLIGWWSEHFFFYVKLRDLDARDSYTEMLINPSFDNTTIDQPTAQVANYHPAGVGMIDYTKQCVDLITEWFFRDEGDAASAYTVTNGTYTWNVAKIKGETVWNSVEDDTTYQDTAANNPVLAVGGDGSFTAEEIDNLRRQYEMGRQWGIVQMSYDDYLKMHGISLPNEELHQPELLRHISEWQYPTNTVEPTTGVPTSAVSWSIRENASKDRRFTEPGFIVGVCVVRPKVYLRNQTGSFSAIMNNVQRWLPANFWNDARARFANLADNVGPYQANTDSEGYWVDIADLLSYGEQFINFAPASTTDNMLALPNAAATNFFYPPDFAGIQELFVGATPAAMVEQDGVVSLQIATHIYDMSPRGGPAGVAIG